MLEDAVLEWFGALGYELANGTHIAPGEPAAERADFREVILRGRLLTGLRRLNPELAGSVLQEAERQVLAAASPALLSENRRLHRLLVDGVTVEVPHEAGGVRGVQVRLIDWDEPANNDWLAVNQFAVKGASVRRPDVVVFVNGLPVAVLELKDPGDEEASVWEAFSQLQTYKQEIPDLFRTNALLVASDGVDARIGSLTSPSEWFLPWRTIEGHAVAAQTENALAVLVAGVFDKARFLDLVRHFIAFTDEGSGLRKVLAGYHQFHATRQAVATTLEASAPDGDRKAGVVWHTQGSGKSLTMAFYAGKAIAQPQMANPTIVVLTDRNDLDDQLFGVFAAASDLIRQTPMQAEDRDHLRRLLSVPAGGVVFTTIQKFLPDEGAPYPTLSERRNVVVIADEAHRSQYGFIDGFARHMRDALPNATFVAFTGTPVELDDRDTRNVFGDYIDRYDIARAIADGATVPINYESRLAKLDLRGDEVPRIDEAFEEATEGEEVARVEQLKTRWAQLEAVVGTDQRLEMIARDLVQHFELRQGAMIGKAMVVVMSRRIAVDLYREITKLKPDWHADDDAAGAIKVVITGSASDPVDWQQHIRSKSRRAALADRFKDPDDPFRMVIVRDMWLTGFDAPSLHTMYVDKPMRGHGLMQAIARVNRVFRDKPGGLVVDYIGIADDLRRALSVYAQSGGTDTPVVDQDDAVRAMRQAFEVCRDLFHGFDYSDGLRGTPAERMALLPAAQDHVLGLEEGRQRFTAAVSDLSKAFALAVPRDEAIEVRDEVAFFQAVKAALVKSEAGRHRPPAELDHAIRQIVAGAVAPGEVVDIFAAAGLPKPDIGLLSDEFLADVRRMPHRNLAVELLRKLLDDEIRHRSRRNLVEARTFSEMLEATVRRYQNRAIETAQVIEELIALAKEMQAARARGEELGLTDDELAFYDALETNDSAVAVMGDDVLREIARELTEMVRRNATIDWTLKESVRARLRAMVRRILRRHGYPPDKQEQATRTVLAQAEQLGLDFAEAPTTVVAGPERLIIPFVRVAPAEVVPFQNAVPLYTLEAAAGGFSGEQTPEPEDWVRPTGRIGPGPGLLVARVTGESMNRRIPNGAYCLFRHPVEGSRDHRILLVEQESITDPDHGGRYTVKVYRSEREQAAEATWRHLEIRLEPDSTDSGYEPIVLAGMPEESVRVVAEVVEVLPGAPVAEKAVREREPYPVAFGGEVRPAAFDATVEETLQMQRPLMVDPPRLTLGAAEESALRIGLGRTDMDIRWMAWLDEDDRLRLWRSWTGFEMFTADFTRDSGTLRLTRLSVESDPERYAADESGVEVDFAETLHQCLSLVMPSP